MTGGGARRRGLVAALVAAVATASGAPLVGVDPATAAISNLQVSAPSVAGGLDFASTSLHDEWDFANGCLLYTSDAADE